MLFLVRVTFYLALVIYLGQLLHLLYHCNPITKQYGVDFNVV